MISRFKGVRVVIAGDPGGWDDKLQSSLHCTSSWQVREKLMSKVWREEGRGKKQGLIYDLFKSLGLGGGGHTHLKDNSEVSKLENSSSLDWLHMQQLAKMA